MASTHLAVVCTDDELEGDEGGAYVEEEVRADDCGLDDDAVDELCADDDELDAFDDDALDLDPLEVVDDLRAEIDNLKADKESLQGQVDLLRGLAEVSAAAHRATRERLADASESLGLSRETATLWEDLYHAVEARGRSTGLVVAVVGTLAGAVGYLLAVAQFGAFFP